MLEKRPPLIVLRGNDICFLGIMRSCGKANIPYKTISFTWSTAKPWWSEQSIYFSNDFEISNPFDNPEKSLEELVLIGSELLETYSRRLLVIPSSDTNLMLFLDNEERLSPYFILMGAKKFDGYREDVVHKYKFFELLNRTEKTISPLTYRCSRLSDIDNVTAHITYPAIYKPAVKDYGQTFYAKNNGLKAIECKNKKELKERLASVVKSGFDVVVQEKIIFDRVEDEIPFYLYSDENHEIKMAATGIKELIQPYPYGTANILRLTWHEELLPLAQSVVKALSWRGILMIEFIKDKKDGEWKVIEVNPRPWLFIGFYERFGLNYLSCLYDDWVDSSRFSEKELVTPLKEVLKKSPLHIDILSIFQLTNQEEKKNIISSNLGDISTWFANYGKCLTMPYFDQQDSMPGFLNISEVASSLPLDKGILNKEICKLLCDLR